jgi:hypothetical protein
MKNHSVWTSTILFVLLIAFIGSVAATITKAPDGSLHLSSGVTIYHRRKQLCVRVFPDWRTIK